MITYSLGIDLGTSRSSCATSIGTTETSMTVVGYPKDIISQKRFKNRPYLLGEEAIQNRLALDMIWPLEDGILNIQNPRAIESARIILETLIKNAIPNISKEDTVKLAIGVPAKCSIENKKDVLKLCEGLANKVLIVSEPFCIAYMLNRLDEVLVIDVGAGTADCCLIQGRLPTEEDQISLITAGNFLDRQIHEAVLGKYPHVQLTAKIVKDIKEKYGYVSNTSDTVKVKLTEKGVPNEYDITELLRQCCLKMTEPIGKAIQALVGNFDPEFQHKLRDNIIVAGGGSRLKGIDKALEKSLENYGGAKVEVVQDAEFTGCKGALSIALEFPNHLWDKLE